jgi:hypothetical protein
MLSRIQALNYTADLDKQRGNQAALHMLSSANDPAALAHWTNIRDQWKGRQIDALGGSKLLADALDRANKKAKDKKTAEQAKKNRQVQIDKTANTVSLDGPSVDNIAAALAALAPSIMQGTLTHIKNNAIRPGT